MPIRIGMTETSTPAGSSGATPERKRISPPLPEIPPSGNRQSTSPLRSSPRTRRKKRCIAFGRRIDGTRITPRYQKMKRVGTNSSTS